MDDTRDVSASAWPPPEPAVPAEPAGPAREERRWLPPFFGGFATGGLSVVLLGTAILVGSGVLFDDNGGRFNPPPEPSPTVTVLPSQDPDEETGIELLMQPATRCAWPQLEAPWEPMHEDWARDELLNPVGQGIVISDSWIAPFFVGQLNEEFVEYGGSDELKDSVKALSNSLVDRYYNEDDGSNLKGLDKGSASSWKQDFDGHEGYVLQRNLTWDEPQSGETEEMQIVAVIDIDGDRAVGVEIALPGTQRDQYLIVLDALLSIRFLD